MILWYDHKIIGKQATRACARSDMNENKQLTLDLSIPEITETIAQATARQALACYDGDRRLALRWVDANLDYLQQNYDSSVLQWGEARDAWVARGYKAEGFRSRPGYPNAKRRVLLEARDIIQEAK